MMNPFESIRRSLVLSSGRTIRYYSLAALEQSGCGHASRLPYCLRVILESLVRHQEHPAFTPEHVRGFAAWEPSGPRSEYPFLPTRVLLQDFTGVPCVVDLAALRDAMRRAGGDPAAIEPSLPVDLVIDHSVQLDEAGCPGAYAANLRLEMERNRERYLFLRWGQAAFRTLRVMPPGLGICHQVNMEQLGTCVSTCETPTGTLAYPDSVVGTDSHTPMINSMGIAGWGVGGIEAEAAMLGQPIPILSPIVTGVRLTGRLNSGVTPTDIALTLVEMLRAKGVVGHFVEYFGPGLDRLTLADRAPMANMTPEYGATMGFFPIDNATLDYLRMTGRDAEHIELVEAYARAQGLFRADDAENLLYSSVVELDLGSVVPSVAGPKRPQDRLAIADVATRFTEALTRDQDARGFGIARAEIDRCVEVAGKGTLTHGAVVLASITSCTNTSNPSLLLGAGLLAKKAVERGLRVPAWVRTSFAPGSRVAGDYLARAGLAEALDKLGFHIAAYGCATCIGNSGPLAPDVAAAIVDNDLIVAAVLSGNRNFEGRIHPLTQANYLCSPPLVVAYALRGNVTGNLDADPIGIGADGKPVFLREIWPSEDEIARHLEIANDPALYRKHYAALDETNPDWNALPAPEGATYAWDEASSYIRHPPWLDGATQPPPSLTDIDGAVALGVYGDFVTTDHISPAGAIGADSAAGQYLIAQGVPPSGFNSYGARRGNHEVMVRGTFANIRIRNKLVEQPGGFTMHHPSGEQTTIYEASRRYAATGTPLLVLAGKMYGAGSSRDWAAKGPALLGVRTVIAENYERIHRSNLVGMGILPLEFVNGQTIASLGLTGHETFRVHGISQLTPGARLTVTAVGAATLSFEVLCRIDSPVEYDYYLHGGILPFVLRKTAGIGA
jgi:aconitate hydratase